MLNPPAISQSRYFHPKKSIWLRQQNDSVCVQSPITKSSPEIHVNPAEPSGAGKSMEPSDEHLQDDMPLDFSMKKSKVPAQNGSTNCDAPSPLPVESRKDYSKEMSRNLEAIETESRSASSNDELDDGFALWLKSFSSSTRCLERGNLPQYPRWPGDLLTANMFSPGTRFTTLPVMNYPISPYVNGHVTSSPFPFVSSIPILPASLNSMGPLSGGSLLPIATIPNWSPDPEQNGGSSHKKSNLFNKFAADIVSRHIPDEGMNSNEWNHDVYSRSQKELESANWLKKPRKCEQSSQNEESAKIPTTSSHSPPHSTVEEGNQKSDSNIIGNSSDSVPDNQPSSSTEQFDTSTGRYSRKRGRPLPDDMKDSSYRMKRDKNNLAAKRSRDNRRQRNNFMAAEAQRYENKNCILECLIVEMENKLNHMRNSISETDDMIERKKLELGYLNQKLSQNQLCNRCAIKR